MGTGGAWPALWACLGVALLATWSPALTDPVRAAPAEPEELAPNASELDRRVVESEPPRFPRVRWNDLSVPSFAGFATPTVFESDDLECRDRADREGWRCAEDFRTATNYFPARLGALFPRAVTDYYPFGMRSKKHMNPYLTRLPRALKELKGEAPGFGPNSEGEGESAGKYMHLQLIGDSWGLADKTLGLLSPEIEAMRLDRWTEECMSPELIREWDVKTHWKILLMGTRGTGMFEHRDALRTSSWHLHLVGAKRWKICGVPERDSGSFAKGRKVCFDEVLTKGQVLFYPRDWDHETEIPTEEGYTVTGTIADADNAAGVLSVLADECAGKPGKTLNFGLSAALCDALQGPCFDYWKNEYARRYSSKASEREFVRRSWRDEAAPAAIEKAEKTSPWHDNYDGRNFVSE